MKKLVAIMAVLAMATAAQATSITWVGEYDTHWHHLWRGGAYVNWAGDLPTHPTNPEIAWDANMGDYDVYISGPTSLTVEYTGAISVTSLNIDTSAGDVEWWEGGYWGSMPGINSGIVNIDGAGTWNWTGYVGWGWSRHPVEPDGPVVYNLNAGVWRMADKYGDGKCLGDGSVVNLNGGEFLYDESSNNQPFTGATTFNVTADSTLTVSNSSSFTSGWADNTLAADPNGTAIIDIDAGATLTVRPGGTAATFYLDSELKIDVVGDTGGLMDITDGNNLTLDGNSVLTLNCTGTQTGPIVLVDYTGGVLTGTFATETGVPGGLYIDYAHAGGTQIALVPEPATMGLLALGGLAVLLRRRRS